MKKVLIGIAVALVLLAGGVGALLYSVFGANKPVEDGASYGRITVIEDVPYVSVYLVDVGGGKYVLVDGGATDAPDDVHAKLERHGVTPDDLVAVLLTHGHGDHIAAARALPDIPLYAHELDVDLVEGRHTPSSTVATLTGPNPAGLKVDETFAGGDVLEFGEVSFRVFHTPGHTRGNSAFLVDGVLLLGDTAQVTTEDELAPPPEIFSSDPAEAIAAIRELSTTLDTEGTPPERMVGSHSGSTTNLDALTNFEGE